MDDMETTRRTEWPLRYAEERRRIARDVHDSLGQFVAGIGMSVSRLRSTVPDPDANVGSLLDRLSSLVGQLSGAVRRLETELHPPLLEQLGLKAALDEYLKAAAEAGGFAWRLDCPDEDMPAVAGGATALFRIVEAFVHEQLAVAPPREIGVSITPGDACTALSFRILAGSPGPSAGTAPREPSVVGLEEWVRAAGGRLEAVRAVPDARDFVVTLPHLVTEET